MNNQVIVYELIQNKSIQKFMERQMKYWIPVNYGKRKFIMTFEFNIYEIK